MPWPARTSGGKPSFWRNSHQKLTRIIRTNNPGQNSYHSLSFSLKPLFALFLQYLSRRGGITLNLPWQRQLPFDFREVQFPPENRGAGLQLLDLLLHQVFFQLPVFMDELAVFFE